MEVANRSKRVLGGAIEGHLELEQVLVESTYEQRVAHSRTQERRGDQRHTEDHIIDGHAIGWI